MAADREADLLAKGKRFGDAATNIAHCWVWLVRKIVPTSNWRWPRLCGDRTKQDAKKILDGLPTSPPDLNAQRLFNLGELDRSANDDQAFVSRLAELRLAAPTSTWLQQTLLASGNYYLLQTRLRQAIDAYRELQQRFPNAGRASYAHWKVAWLSLRQGRNAEARRDLSSKSPCTQLQRRSQRLSTGAPGWPRKTTIRRWRALTTRSCRSASQFYYGELARRDCKR